MESGLDKPAQRTCRFCRKQIANTSVVCEHCGGQLIARGASIVEEPIRNKPRKRPPAAGRIICWFCAAVGSLIGMATFLQVTQSTTISAPQQAAGAGMALCWAVLPYVFARAVEQMVQDSRE